MKEIEDKKKSFLFMMLMYMNMRFTSSWSSKPIFSTSRFSVYELSTRYRQDFHTSTRLGLNRYLFDPSEIDDKEEEGHTHSEPSVTLPRNDYRTIHAAKVLRLQNNDTLRAGIVEDNLIELKTKHNNKYNRTISSIIPQSTVKSETYGGLTTDEATITWIPEGKIKKAEPTKNGDPPGSLRIKLNSLSSSNNHSHSTDVTPQISLMLALPRPLALARVLPMISMMGVDHLILTSAQKVPKDYFGSHLFRKPNEIRKLLIEGLCQAGDVKIPTVKVVNRLKPFLEDDLDVLFPKDEWARVIAHPLRKQSDDDDGVHIEDISFSKSAMRMDDIEFPSSSKKILLAVGPEGGWSEPYELDMFRKLNFQQITLGTRILRSDVAVVNLLGLAHNVCSR